MWTNTLLLCFCFSLLLLLPNAHCVSDVTIKNLRLFVDDKEFFVKAMCYNPVPLGIESMDENFANGGGLCSVKRTPFGEWKSACYDSDYFDGSTDISDRYPPGPPEGWFQSSWKRDFPLMKELGANTLRIYNTNPTTRLASVQHPELIQEPLGKDHIPFMDMAQQHDFKVIFPLAGDKTMLLTMAPERLRQLLMWQIDEVGNHPALLMWNFGNELGVASEPDLLNKVNDYIHFIREYTRQKWNRTIPITSAVVDLPLSYNSLAATLNVDIFTSNAGYRGLTFSDLWSGNANFEGWHKLSCRYQKPLFVGEIGFHSLNNSITGANPHWFNSQWKDLLMHIDQGCIGGAFFEYSDEPHSKVDPLQQSMGLVSFTVGESNGQRSTSPDVWVPDNVEKKEVFEAVKSGTFEGQQYNMNGNVWDLIGRPQSTLGGSHADICSNFSFVRCPGSPPCSYHGVCDWTTTKCTCNTGYTGDDCAAIKCPGNPPCSGKGKCNPTLSPPVCECDSGWQGLQCQDKSTPGSCPGNCKGNGDCETSTGICRCKSEWTGSDCSIPVVSTNPRPTHVDVATTSKTNDAFGLVPTLLSLVVLLAVGLF